MRLLGLQQEVVAKWLDLEQQTSPEAAEDSFLEPGLTILNFTT
jgi:hypothetical protein